MKKIVLSGVFFCAFMIAIWATVPGTDFSGTWALDAARSEGLPQQMQGDLTWVITQDDKSLKKEVKGMMATTENYKLDGSENEEEVSGRISGKAKRSAKAMGEMIELKSVLNAEFNGNAFTMTTVQHLELADGGKTLKVHQVSETPRGNRESKLVFTKK